MNNDAELLELAAKAYGLDLTQRYVSFSPCGREIWFGSESSSGWRWCPFFDDGDAFKLAAHLHMSVSFGPMQSCASTISGTLRGNSFIEKHPDHNMNVATATRRAIVRAAAETGRKV